MNHLDIAGFEIIFKLANKYESNEKKLCKFKNPKKMQKVIINKF